MSDIAAATWRSPAGGKKTRRTQGLVMFIITNRELRSDRTGLEQFGPRANSLGPNELRMVEVTRAGRAWKVEIIPDELDAAWRARAGIDAAWLTSMGFDPDGKVFGSMYVASQVLARVNPRRAGAGPTAAQGKNLLVFVHGYNNDIRDIIERAASFERNFGVEVIAFSWPANGGGVIGTASYLSDKNDAKISIGALDRALAKLGDLLGRFNMAWVEDVRRRADAVLVRHPGNEERRRERIAEIVAAECPFTVNLLLHSMGNYVYKHLLLSTASFGTALMFDNVVLAAADTNNKDHAQWVDRIKARRRVFVTINESDHALRVSRMKFGEAQLARLGHYPFDLNASQAVYIDFTGAPKVGSSHAYFEGEPLANVKVRRFFNDAVNGTFAERSLPFDEAMGTYRMNQDRRSARRT